MTAPGQEESVSSDFVRSYVITGGRSLPSSDDLALHTLVTLAPERTPPLGAGPEVTAIWDLCAGGYLSGGGGGGAPRPAGGVGRGGREPLWGTWGQHPPPPPRPRPA
ncbi:DUF742 domain-containing protein, partial [Streptomyces prasinus]|uniref:DUF742 domain-containing protein n=1 Tax=Streptomyces prasinus TaxID=67345 RepID=UPI00363B5865